MAKNTKKISISSLDKAIKNRDGVEGQEVTLSWYGIDVTVKRRLSLYEMMKFVQTVVDNCVRKTDGKYLPEVFDFIVNNNIVEFYTNIVLPEKAERRYDVLCSCRDLIGLVLEKIDELQYNEMLDAIRTKIEYEARSNIDAMMKKAKDTQAMIESAGSILASMVDGIDPEMFNNAIKTIATDDKIDEEKMMEAYLRHMERGENGEH